MNPNDDFPVPYGSFRVPAGPPAPDPDEPPFVCVQFNASWLPAVLGCLLQLQLPATWTGSEVLVRETICDAMLLFDLFMDSYTCTWQHTFDFHIAPYDDIWGGPDPASGFGTIYEAGVGWHPIADADSAILFDLFTIRPVGDTVGITSIEVTAISSVGGTASLRWCDNQVPSGAHCSEIGSHAWENFTQALSGARPPAPQNLLHIVGPGAPTIDDVTLVKLVISGGGIDPWPTSPV